MLRDQHDAIFILPAADAQGVSFTILRNRDMYGGTLTTPAGPRSVYVVEGKQHDDMYVASLMWHYGFRGTLMATQRGLWLAHPARPGVLRGVRLRTKQPWFLGYGLVDAELPR